LILAVGDAFRSLRMLEPVLPVAPKMAYLDMVKI
jgi:hypothetical protein